MEWERNQIINININMATKKIKVLLVEDDKMILDMYQMRLKEEEWIVFTTERGSEAIVLAKKQKPNIILLDIMLPEVDGFTILQELKSDPATKKIPVFSPKSARG